MKKKIMTSIAAVSIVVAMVTGCGSSSSTSAGSSSSTKATSDSNSTASSVDMSDIKVAGMVYYEDQHASLVQAGMKGAAEEYGVQFFNSNCGQDQSKETEYINTYVSQGIQGIAISPLSADGSIASLKAAAEDGVKIALSDTTLNDTSFIECGFTSDQYQLGESTGEVAKKFIEEELGGKAKIAVIQFKAFLAENSVPRVEGFEDQVTQLDGVEIVSDQDGWETDKVYSMVTDILNSDMGVNIIFCNNETAIVAAESAIEAAGKQGEVYLFGVDGSKEIAEILQEDTGVLVATTAQDPYALGYDTMEAVIKSIIGENTGFEKGQTIGVEGTLLSKDDQETVQAYLDKLASVS